MLLIGLLVVACGGGASSGGDARVTDAGVTDAGSTLFGELFGPQDPNLPGKSCRSQEDQCRGSSRLYVCLDDAGQSVAADTTCRACTSDAQCENEYFYYMPQGLSVTCGSDGLCHPTGSDGVARDGDYCDPPGAGWCNTARDGWFVCGMDHHCVRCTTVEQCGAAYGCSWICPKNSGPVDGACMDVVPPPPGCG